MNFSNKRKTDILIGVLLNQPMYQFGEHWHFYRLRLPICECNMVLHLLFLKFISSLLYKFLVYTFCTCFVRCRPRYFTLSAVAFELLVSQSSLLFGVNDTMILLPKTSSFSIRFRARSALSRFMKRRMALQPVMFSTFPPQLSDRRLSLLLMLLPSLLAGRL